MKPPVYHSPARTDNLTRVLIKSDKAPGDIVLFTACIENVARQFPGYTFKVKSCCNDAFLHNPHCSNFLTYDKLIELDYPRPSATNKSFLVAYCEFLLMALGLKGEVIVNRPYLYLSQEEETQKPRYENYVVINAGYKLDISVKHYPYWQEVTDYLLSRGATVVQVGEPWHVHKALRGTVDLIGKTNFRELFLLVSHARLVLSPESMLQWVASAFQKPCICVASGRDTRGWVGSETTKMISKIMPCCQLEGCNRQWVKKIDCSNNRPVCLLPLEVKKEWVAACMDIEPEIVIEEIQKM